MQEPWVKLHIDAKDTENTYAIYIYARKKDSLEFEKIREFWYSTRKNFFFILEQNYVEVKFKFFIKDQAGQLIHSEVSKNFSRPRKIKTMRQLDFNSDFDIDFAGNYLIPIRFSITDKSKKIYILFNGALKENFDVYPTYNRSSWKERFNENIFNIYDATLNMVDGYLLGWYQGTLDQPLEEDIVALINKMKLCRGVSNTDLIFYGSSGGGWAALKYALLFEGSQAVAINPQIDILKYSAIESVNKFLNYSCKGLTISEAEKEIGERLKISPDDFQRSKSTFIIAQNIKDTPHYRDHFLPFWSRFSLEGKEGWDNKKMNYAIVYDHESGHGGEPEEVFSFIQDMINARKIG